MTSAEKIVTTGTIDFIDPSTGKVPLHQVALRLHPQDHVAIAKINLQHGTILILENNDSGSLLRVPIRQFIPSGHKVALIGLAPGQELRRYGQIIGFATQPIQPGEHVHTHNLGMQDFARDYARCDIGGQPCVV